MTAGPTARAPERSCDYLNRVFWLNRHVETATELEDRKLLGCEFGQGFLSASPLPLDLVHKTAAAARLQLSCPDFLIDNTEIVAVQRDSDGFRGGSNTKPADKVGTVHFHRANAQPQFERDLLVGQSVREKA